MTANRFETDSFPKLLTEGLWVLGNYYFNLYLVKGEQASALIEVGVSAVADEVIRQLDELQVSPTFVVVTHPHADHITGLPALREKFPQTLVVAAEGAPEFLAHPKAGKALVPEDRYMTNFLEAHGLKPGRPPVDEAPTLENCLIARDMDEMDLGGLTLRFLSVKGHAPGKIAVWIPQIKALVLSDSLGFRFPGRGVMPLFLTGYADYVATLDRLEALQHSIIGVAHQGPVVGRKEVEEAFREARQSAVELRDRILSYQGDPDNLVHDIFKTYYRDELTLYTEENIVNCARLLVKRAKESAV
jgi:glyoxylase-like metal-dependent hydrolase (beta-lactamase superfamily II)